jgi:hypothetical protein
MACFATVPRRQSSVVCAVDDVAVALPKVGDTVEVGAERAWWVVDQGRPGKTVAPRTAVQRRTGGVVGGRGTGVGGSAVAVGARVGVTVGTAVGALVAARVATDDRRETAAR